MGFMCRATLVLLLAGAVPRAAMAGSLRMEFRDGYVTISAADVPLRQVLTEWARLGHTRVINGEKLGGGLLTLELANVPEKQALEILLRGVPGYMAAQRAAPLPGGSQFDRIMVMPGTVAPPTPGVAMAPPPPAPPPPMPPITVEDQDEPVRQEAPEQPGVEPEQLQPQQPMTLPQPGVQPVAPAPQEQTDGGGTPQQQPGGVVSVPANGVLVSPNPGQLPVPPAKPPEQDR